MIVYLDTSALLPLLIEEPGSAITERLWGSATYVVSVRLMYAEARAALAQAARLARIRRAELASTVQALDGLYGQMDLVEVDDGLVRRAGELAEVHELRGYDAIHLAAADRLGPRTVFASGDQQLCIAARRHGLAVADTCGQ